MLTFSLKREAAQGITGPPLTLHTMQSRDTRLLQLGRHTPFGDGDARGGPVSCSCSPPMPASPHGSPLLLEHLCDGDVTDFLLEQRLPALRFLHIGPRSASRLTSPEMRTREMTE